MQEDPEEQDLSRVLSGTLGLVKVFVVVVELSLRSDTLLPQESSPYIAASFLRWFRGSVPAVEQQSQPECLCEASNSSIIVFLDFQEQIRVLRVVCSRSQVSDGCCSFGGGRG